MAGWVDLAIYQPSALIIVDLPHPQPLGHQHASATKACGESRPDGNRDLLQHWHGDHRGDRSL
jgi:hypothetical protein